MEGRQRKLFTGFGVALLFLLAFAVFFQTSFQTVVVSGDSMEPTFRDGQRLLVCRAYWLVGQIRRNDIVVIRGQDGKGFLIKRVHRLGGEVVDFMNVPDNWRITHGEFRVPKDHLYVIGDNYAVSEDSRKYGPVPLSRVIGKVVVIR